MNTEAKFESVTIELLKRLKSKKEAIQMRHAAEIAEIEKEIEAVSITLRLIRETNEVSEGIEIFKPTVIPSDLSGLSTREACIEIAKRNDGIIRVGEAKDAIVSAGILKPSKNTWGIVYTTLIRSKEFEKAPAGRGAFRLIESVPLQERQQGSLLQ